MSKVLVTESHLQDIASAIRAKNGSSDTYRPGAMAGAILAIPTGGITPTGTIVISANGTVDVAQYANAAVNVQPNLQSKTATQNGTITPDSGYDGLSSVVVNVSGGGGGGGDWPFIDEIVGGDTGFTAKVHGTTELDLDVLSASVKKFYQDYARTPKPTTMDYNITITQDDEGLTLRQLRLAHTAAPTMEYYGYVYGNTSMIEDLGLVLLGDFSQQGATTGNALSDSVYNYSAMILQGIYNRNRTSQYNTSMLYGLPVLGDAYWAGMKDRNSSYDCRVTFTDGQTVNMNGNRQVIIYGVP